MRAVGLKILKNKLSEYVRLVAGGETVLVTDRDRVVAELVPPREGRSPLLADAMRGIDPALLRAAHSLGASPAQAFRRIYLPLSAPGIAGGALLVFILSLGFFITPALMGGPSDMMIAMLIEREVEFTLNWSFASALAVILLLLTLVGFVVYSRVVRLARLFEGRA